jgi:DNA-binding NtrC family response regulator
MPYLSVVELATKIKAFYPDCKVLLFSGVVDLFMHRSPQLSRFEILEKPLHPTVLLQRVEQLLDQAHSAASSRLIAQNSEPERTVQGVCAPPFHRGRNSEDDS